MVKSTSSQASSCSTKSSATVTSSRKSNGDKDVAADGDRLHMKWSSSMDRKKRLAANARERKRMHLLNEAYDKLRGRLVDAENKSKYDVLVQAKEYIQALASICERFDTQEMEAAKSIASSSANERLDQKPQQQQQQPRQPQSTQQALIAPIMSPNVSLVISPSPPMSNESDQSQSINETYCQNISTSQIGTFGCDTASRDFTRFYQNNIAHLSPTLFSPQPEARDYSMHQSSQYNQIQCQHRQLFRFPTNAT